MPAPGSFPDFATNANYAGGPNIGTPTKSAPSAGRIQDGWRNNDVPPAQEHNWLFSFIGQWIRYFVASLLNIVDGGSYIASGTDISIGRSAAQKIFLTIPLVMVDRIVYQAPTIYNAGLTNTTFNIDTTSSVRFTPAYMASQTGNRFHVAATGSTVRLGDRIHFSRPTSSYNTFNTTIQRADTTTIFTFAPTLGAAAGFYASWAVIEWMDEGGGARWEVIAGDLRS